MDDNTIIEAQVRNQYGIMYDSLPRDSYTLALFKKMGELKSFMEVYEQGFIVYRALSKSTSPFDGLSSDDIKIALAFVRDEVTPDEFNPIFELPDLIETAMLENEQEEIKLTSLGFRAKSGRRKNIESDLYIVGLVDSLLLYEEHCEDKGKGKNEVENEEIENQQIERIQLVPTSKLFKRVALALLTDDIVANARSEDETNRAEFILDSLDIIISEREKGSSLLNSVESIKYRNFIRKAKRVYKNLKKIDKSK
jgi:hypothetical protein